MSPKVTLEVARMAISFESQHVTLTPLLSPFLSRRKAELTVTRSFSKPPLFKENRYFYQREGGYRFYRIAQGDLIKTDCLALEEELKRDPLHSEVDNLPKAILIDPSLKKAVFFLESEKRETPLPILWHYVYLLTSHLLMRRRRGFFIHAGGVSDRGRGFLFVGPSGAGKSTITTLFGQRRNVSVLGDDFMVIRKEKRGPSIYGTPLIGNLPSFSPKKGTPLEAIFFLTHGKENRLTSLSTEESVKRFLSEVPPILWVPEGLSFSAEFSLDLCATLPTYELAFLPDASVVSFLRRSFER